MTTGLGVFTLVHVIISLVGIGAGLVVSYGFLTSCQPKYWATVFLSTTALTSATGFFFPFQRFTPAHAVGIISLAVLAFAVLALYRFHLAGRWRVTYVIASVIALYLNAFVLVVQLFQKVPALTALAPTQSEPPFVLTQAFVFAFFFVIAIVGIVRFRVTSIFSDLALAKSK